MQAEFALALFLAVCLILMLGFPVALTLAGVSLVFAAIGTLAGGFDPTYLVALPARIFGTMSNETLIAVPLFILMGNILERARIAEDLLNQMAQLFGRRPGGLGISVVLVGALLAASTGIVGATVVTMGLLSLPTMLRAGYSPSIATGTICATGTLGQIIPPSIALVLLGDIISSAYQRAQLEMGVINTATVSVGDLFIGALVPGLILVACYVLWIAITGWVSPKKVPPIETSAVSVKCVVTSLRLNRAGTWVDPGRRSNTNRSLWSGCSRGPGVSHLEARDDMVSSARHWAKYPASDQHDFSHPDWCFGLFAGVSRLWRRGIGSGVFSLNVRRSCRCTAIGHGGYFFVGLYS